MPTARTKTATNASKPEKIVAGDTLIVQVDGKEISVPLSLPGRFLRMAGETSEQEMAMALLDHLLGSDVVDEMDSISLMRLYRDFMTAWQERMQASLGESLPSGD